MSDDDDLPDLTKVKPAVGTITREIFDLLLDTPGSWVDLKSIQLRMKKQGLGQAVANTVVMLRNRYHLDIERKSIMCYNFRLISDNRGKVPIIYVKK